MPTGAEALDELPNRLKPIVPLLAEGLTNDQISGVLVLALHTVEGYVSEIKQRVDARDRVDLVIMCQKYVA